MITVRISFFFFFFFNDTATTEIYTLSLHDALPIYGSKSEIGSRFHPWSPPERKRSMGRAARGRCRRESAAASGKKKHMSDVPFLSALQNLKNEVASRSCGWGRWLIKGMYAVLDQGLISGSNFLLGILLARWTGAEQYGAYALAFAIFILDRKSTRLNSSHGYISYAVFCLKK